MHANKQQMHILYLFDWQKISMGSYTFTMSKERRMY